MHTTLSCFQLRGYVNIGNGTASIKIENVSELYKQFCNMNPDEGKYASSLELPCSALDDACMSSVMQMRVYNTSQQRICSLVSYAVWISFLNCCICYSLQTAWSHTRDCSGKFQRIPEIR